MPKPKITRFISFLGINARIDITEKYFPDVNLWEISTENDQPIPMTKTGYKTNWFFDDITETTIYEILDNIAERNGIPRTQIQLLDEPFTPKEDNTYTDTKDALKTHLWTQSKELQQGYLF
jgi:hypothetical protein